jgi:hypothetical protein
MVIKSRQQETFASVTRGSSARTAADAARRGTLCGGDRHRMLRRTLTFTTPVDRAVSDVVCASE